MRTAVRAILLRDDKILMMHRNKFGEEYYVLPGGGVKLGESAHQALKRELMEECSLTLKRARHVFSEDAGDPYGLQAVYLCEVADASVEPRLHPQSEEAQIHAMGKNLFTPQWVPLAELPALVIRSAELKQALLLAVEHGFPPHPVLLDRDYLATIHNNAAKKG